MHKRMSGQNDDGPRAARLCMKKTAEQVGGATERVTAQPKLP
jgi:hypothetical protein